LAQDAHVQETFLRPSLDRIRDEEFIFGKEERSDEGLRRASSDGEVHMGRFPGPNPEPGFWIIIDPERT
jgi:hypothetical protein